eukprot:TRINITY_DN1962_c0_g2_i2.p1 TRINITY_DN1962_c0_g2~~TRINITY_DN1962_c0_g2_i2.p1  ORF type:complete len:255 (+),score=62.34 TRINITY_DN1962_c0_g2_i2:73-837(+)
MGVIKAKVAVSRPDVEERPSSEDDSILEPQIEGGSFEVEAVPRSSRRSARREARILNGIMDHSSKGTTLALKKGRRSRHRYENEKLLTTQHEDELIWDIVDRTSSSHRFTQLKEDVLSRFYYGDECILNEEDADGSGQEAIQDPENFDPEAAYLNIGFNLRTALKKSVPVGMLSRLEEDIVNFFMENPKSFYIADELSSFERLLAHACSSYHYLQSHSFNERGKRKLKIGNPKSGFFKPEPCLSSYIQERFSRQ